MELTADLIAIQGILSSKMKHTGDFTRINYKGGKTFYYYKIHNAILQSDILITEPE